jgi:hypothetical protein
MVFPFDLTSVFLRKLVLALCLLGVFAPLAVKAGVQLEPTPIFELTQDLEKSRCSPSGDQSDDQHAMSCCVLCAAPQVPDGSSAVVLPIAFPQFAQKLLHDRQQLAAIKQDIALRHPIPRGPPA